MPPACQRRGCRAGTDWLGRRLWLAFAAELFHDRLELLVHRVWLVSREVAVSETDEVLYRLRNHRQITLLFIEDQIACFLRCRMECVDVVIYDQVLTKRINEAVLVWVIMMNEVVDREELCER